MLLLNRSFLAYKLFRCPQTNINLIKSLDTNRIQFRFNRNRINFHSWIQLNKKDILFKNCNLFQRWMSRSKSIFGCYMSTNIDHNSERKSKNKQVDIKKFNFDHQCVAKEFQVGSETTENRMDQLSNKVFTIPNMLCMMRIGVTPVVSYFIISQSYQYALALCALCSITDYLDGWIARRFQSESKLGAVLDPLADKLLVITLTFTLTYVHLIPLWLTSLIITRDLLIVLGGLYMQSRAISPPVTLDKFFNISKFKHDQFKPTLISKINTGFQLSLVLLTLSSPIFPTIFAQYPYLLQGVQWSTGITTLWSGLNYLTRLR